MWPFPRLLLKWREPKELVWASYAFAEKNTRPWVRPACLLAVVGMSLLLWYLARVDPSKTPASFPIAVGLSFVLGILLVYIVPLINRLCPSEVKLFSNCILRIRGQAFARLPLKEIDSYDWVTDGSFYTLAVVATRKRTLLLGVPDAGTKQRIDSVLGSLGIPRFGAERTDRIAGGR